jgi:hypothetical protein
MTQRQRSDIRLIETSRAELGFGRRFREMRRVGSRTVCRPPGLALDRGAGPLLLAAVWLERGARQVDLESDLPTAVVLIGDGLEGAWQR